jgi:hypothetical protein
MPFYTLSQLEVRGYYHSFAIFHGVLERFHFSSSVLGALPTAAVGMFFRKNNGIAMTPPGSIGLVVIFRGRRFAQPPG